MKELEEVQNFLESHLNVPIGELVEIFGGKHSQAFSYSNNGNKYVVRINRSDRGFKKDEFAYDNFRTRQIPIPQIHEIGILEEGLYFCVSDFVEGESARTQFKKSDFSSFPLQFETLEAIAKSPVQNLRGYGEWDSDGQASFDSFEDFIRNLYQTNNIHDWENLSNLPHYDQGFIDYLIGKIEKILPSMTDERMPVHGDFGNDNFFIQDDTCVGIIDWDKSLIGNHFLDAGRIVLYCPDRSESSRAALAFYKDKGYENYKEKILFGVYYTMLHNYAVAVKEGMKASCESSSSRVQEIEKVFAK